MIAALLGIDIQDPAFAFRQMRPVVQHLLSCQGSGNEGGDIECLLGFCLAGRCTEIAESRYGRIVNPDNLRRGLVCIRRLDLGS